MLTSTKQNFIGAISESRQVFGHCVSARGVHTSPGVESAFLHLYRSWEIFLEESFLWYVCGGSPLTGTPAAPYFVVPNVELAKPLLYQGKKFAEWSDMDRVLTRLAMYFPPGDRMVASLNPVSTAIRDMAVVRNIIAHSSAWADVRFTEVWRRKLGPRPPTVRAADFLMHVDPTNRPDSFFHTYTNLLETTALAITG